MWAATYLTKEAMSPTRRIAALLMKGRKIVPADSSNPLSIGRLNTRMSLSTIRDQLDRAGTGGGYMFYDPAVKQSGPFKGPVSLKYENPHGLGDRLAAKPELREVSQRHLEQLTPKAVERKGPVYFDPPEDAVFERLLGGQRTYPFYNRSLEGGAPI